MSSSDDDQNDLEEEENESINNFLCNQEKTTRDDYIIKNKPIMQYCPNSFEKLNEKSQIILNNNKDIIFRNGVSYQAQIETVISLIYDPSKNSKSGPTAIGRLFGFSHGTISSHFKRIKRQRNHLIGRPPDLDKMQIKILCNHIETSFVLGSPLTIDQISNFIYCKFNVSMRSDTICSNFRKISLFKSVIAKPLDSKRFEVPLEAIADYYTRLDELLLLENIPPQFVFNVDESGFQDICDSSLKHIFVPVNANAPEYYYAVD